jgi:hypothetical protein
MTKCARGTPKQSGTHFAGRQGERNASRERCGGRSGRPRPRCAGRSPKRCSCGRAAGTSESGPGRQRRPGVRRPASPGVRLPHRFPGERFGALRKDAPSGRPAARPVPEKGVRELPLTAEATRSDGILDSLPNVTGRFPLGCGTAGEAGAVPDHRAGQGTQGRWARECSVCGLSAGRRPAAPRADGPGVGDTDRRGGRRAGAPDGVCHCCVAKRARRATQAAGRWSSRRGVHEPTTGDLPLASTASEGKADRPWGTRADG